MAIQLSAAPIIWPRVRSGRSLRTPTRKPRSTARTFSSEGGTRLSRTQQVIDTLEAQCAELRERLAWLEAQLKEAHAEHEDEVGQAPARSARRAPARRAGRGRAGGRTRQLDTKAIILEFLAKHPGSTAG